MAALGVPASVAVPSLLFTKVTPPGSAPVSVITIEALVGEPVVVTVKVPGVPTRKVALLALVIAGGCATVKLKTKLAAMFWPASTSVTCAATTVTRHVTPVGRFADGVRTKLDAGEADSVKVFTVAIGHSSAKDAVVAFTDSLKLTVMVLVGCTPVAAATGTVLVTVGSVSVVKLVT